MVDTDFDNMVFIPLGFEGNVRVDVGQIDLANVYKVKVHHKVFVAHVETTILRVNIVVEEIFQLLGPHRTVITPVAFPLLASPRIPDSKQGRIASFVR